MLLTVGYASFSTQVMAIDLLAQNPFAVLTFIAAPAILTNATSVLAMSTTNRMLRTRDRMHELYVEADNPARASASGFVERTNRVERQAVLLLSALRSIYVALGAFSAAAFVTLLGAVLSQWDNATVTRLVVGVGLLLGFTGVGGLVWGCVNLFHATQLSLLNIQAEAGLIRARLAGPGGAAGS